MFQNRQGTTREELGRVPLKGERGVAQLGCLCTNSMGHNQEELEGAVWLERHTEMLRGGSHGWSSGHRCGKAGLGSLQVVLPALEAYWV